MITEKRNLNNLVILNNFEKEIKKTKEMNLILNKLNITNSLIILDQESKNKIFKSLRNIPNIKVSDINHFNIVDVVRYNKIVFTEASVKELQKRYE